MPSPPQTPNTPGRVTWKLSEKKGGAENVNYSAQKEAGRQRTSGGKGSAGAAGGGGPIVDTLVDMSGHAPNEPMSPDYDAAAPGTTIFGITLNDGYEVLPDVESGVRRGGWRGAFEGIRRVDEENNIYRQISEDVFGKSPMQRSERRRTFGFVAGVLFFVFLISSFGRSMKPHDDEDGVLGGHLMLAGHSLCGGFAPRKDVFDQDTQMCKMENALAFASFAGLDWVSCDKSMPGAQELQRTVDEQGNFWYHHTAKNMVNKFYKSCKPDCASSKDWWDRIGMVCVSGDNALNEWIEACKDSGSRGCYSSKGRGLKCDQNLDGAAKLRVSSAASLGVDSGPPHLDGDSALKVHSLKVSYKAADSKEIIELAKSCAPLCADGDTVDLDDGGWCNVDNTKAIAFFDARKKGGPSPDACDGALEGAKEIETRVGGKYAYPSSRHHEVRIFYESCT